MSMPLEGIRILEWAIWQMGPAATALLGDMGAEIIKIEDRIGGDPSRGLMKIHAANIGGISGRNYYFEAFNRNKKSLTLDVKKQKGKELLYKLVEKSDAFVQNMRVGVAERLGLDYETLSKYNPKLIYAHASAYGPKGPDRARPAVDYCGLSRSGIMTAAGEPDMPPVNIMGATTDQTGAIMTAYGVVAALFARERLGVGQKVDTSLLGSMTTLQTMNVSMTLALGQSYPRIYRAKAGNPLYNHYRCADDKWITLAMHQADRHWHEFCQTMGLQHLENDPKFENIEIRTENSEELVSILDQLFATKSRAEWMRILAEGGDFVYSQINTLGDLVQDPQVLENDYIIDYDHPSLGKTKLVGFPIGMSKTPLRVHTPFPEHGQHTEELLMELLDYTWDDISKLRDEEVI